MEMLTGNGIPSKRLVGEVGQHYKDLETGDVYECKLAEEHSPLHGELIGGYVWARVATGDHMEVCAGEGGSGATSWNDLTDKPFGTEIKNVALATGAVVRIEGEWSNDPAFPVTDNLKGVFDGALATVTINSTEYKTRWVDTSNAFGVTGSFALGNLSKLGGNAFENDNTGEPFVFDYDKRNGRLCMVHENDGTYTVDVTSEVKIVSTIDPKYTETWDMVIRFTPDNEDYDISSEQVTAKHFTIEKGSSKELIAAAEEGRVPKAVVLNFPNWGGAVYDFCVAQHIDIMTNNAFGDNQERITMRFLYSQNGASGTWFDGAFKIEIGSNGISGYNYQAFANVLAANA